jgi:hypothetical protein
MRNHIYVDACVDCWGVWPDAHKLFPARGFGRWDDRPMPERATLNDFGELPATVTQISRGRTRAVYDGSGELVEYELLPASEGTRGGTRREPTMEEIVQVLRETA